MNVISRFINKSAGGGGADYVQLGEKSVKVPKLTPEKYKALFERIETLPQIIVSVLSAKQSDDFVATAIVGANMALDEAVNIVAVLADVEPEYVEKHADLNEISEFIRATIEKNDLQRALKNFRAVLGHFRIGTEAKDGSPD
ncbi:hypothetical protein M6D81_11625 [Paenibacillus sp. J5C_2022]|uniref:hypothetical protein n=1 Tax=Paenibacillus sp. J5C2022 TaxID=2977129 RepID=UPI0021D24050|nr:hypothetical protein [Paenibacillus sp. J5C2022]MCU6709357.1 hypothetical protein [Paenibacillus sp. J5C2022]